MDTNLIFTPFIYFFFFNGRTDFFYHQAKDYTGLSMLNQKRKM